MSRRTRRKTHPLAGFRRTIQRTIGAQADAFSSNAFCHKSSPKRNYPRILSSLASIRVSSNSQIRSASIETQCARTESVAEEAEEDTPWNDQQLCLRTDTGSSTGRVHRQVEKIMFACQTLSPLSSNFCYSIRQYLMEQEAVLLLTTNECSSSSTGGRQESSIDGFPIP